MSFGTQVLIFFIEYNSYLKCTCRSLIPLIFLMKILISCIFFTYCYSYIACIFKHLVNC